MRDVELDATATAELVRIMQKNDAERLWAGLTEEEASRLNLEAAHQALRRRRRERPYGA